MSKSKLKTCKHCGAQIAKSAKVCPACGGKNKKPIFLRAWFIILVVVILLVAIGSSGSGDGSSNHGTQLVGTVDNSAVSENAKPTESAAEVKTIYNVGDILQDDNLQIVYMASGEYTSDNQFLQPKDGNKYIFLEFAFTNTGTSDAGVSTFSFECYADGYAADAVYIDDNDVSATLSAGRSTTGFIYYEVPADAAEIEVEYTPNVFSDRKIKFIYEENKNSGYEVELNTSRSADALAVGDVYEEADSIKITYLSCEDYKSDNMFVEPKAGYHFVSVELEFENLGTSDITVSSMVSFDCYADGVNCDQTFIRDDDLSATISAGRKAKGTLTFEVPDDASVVELEFVDNVWTSDRIVFTVR